MMKKTICYLILQLILGCFAVQAQQGRIQVIPRSFTPKGDVVEVELSFNMQTLNMRSTESITFTPIIVSGRNEHELPKLIIKGANRYKADNRAAALANKPVVTMRSMGVSDRNYPIYAIEKFNKRQYITYRVSVPFRDWMATAILNLKEEMSGCCNQPIVSTLRTNLFNEFTAGGYTDIQPKFRYIVPEQEAVKNRSEIGKAFLDFPQGSSVINPSFRNNQRELDKINQMITMLMADPDIRVTSIEMRGYASPEGSASANLELSSQRARAMREYFVRKNVIASGSILTGIGGEDWEGLKQLLVNYSVSYKDEIFNIINTVQDLDLREQRIMRLGNGEPYRQIFRDLYPQLRRVECRINFTARQFSVDEGKERIQLKPNLLSQSEMYQVAHTYPEGSTDFNRTFITARQYFPDNDIANLNAAAAALVEGDAALAEEYLKQVKNTNSPEYFNCMGVLYIYKESYVAAEEFLLRAQAGGIEEATYNLQELQRKRYR